jgi:hypothetical protein
MNIQTNKIAENQKIQKKNYRAQKIIMKKKTEHKS